MSQPLSELSSVKVQAEKDLTEGNEVLKGLWKKVRPRVLNMGDSRYE